jgi:hypothetical protein
MASASLLVAALAASYLAYLCVSRLLFSPLARFPGPKLAALSNWYEFYYDVILQGRFTAHIQELHRRYGGSHPNLSLESGVWSLDLT